jgi:hypothetical protein
VRRVELLPVLRLLSRLFGGFFLVGAVIVSVEGWTVYLGGATATATVQSQTGDMRHVRYLVSFTGQDGLAHSGWIDQTGSDHLRIGEQIPVRYDPAHPDHVMAARHFLANAVYAPIVILLTGAFLLLLAPPLLLRDQPPAPAAEVSRNP